MRYDEFIESKSHISSGNGFAPIWMPEFLFDFQRDLVEWSIRRGRAAIFADCGMGKTPMQLVWAENVRLKTGGRVLILTPLAVGGQTVREAEKFGMIAARSSAGELPADIVVANYERLHYFNPEDFAGVVCDESSAIKHFAGARRKAVTTFLRKIPCRLLCTATAAPNDYTELGTSSEALGEMGLTDMLGMYFRNEQGNSVETSQKWRMQKSNVHEGMKWRFKRHAQVPFWRWVASWARAVRRPSDLGYSDDRFQLPELRVEQTIVATERLRNGLLFQMPAVGLSEQREERRISLTERCEAVASKVAGDEPAVVWCQMNDEADLCEEIIPGAVQVSGADSDARKEEVFADFAAGKIRVLVTKPKIAGFGLNWQHCNRMTFFPSHSFEQFYQGVRRCWRFGQSRPVHVDIITTEGELSVLANLNRKAKAADLMFDTIVQHMGQAITGEKSERATGAVEVPSWL